MLVRVGLVSSSVIALNTWQAHKVHAAEPSTAEQPVKKKIRPSEVSDQLFSVLCLFVIEAGHTM